MKTRIIFTALLLTFGIAGGAIANNDRETKGKERPNHKHHEQRQDHKSHRLDHKHKNHNKHSKGPVKRVSYKTIKPKWKAPHYHYGYKRKTLPKASISIRLGNINFRYNSGIFYRPHKHGFVVVKAPIGARIKVLPAGYRRIIIGPTVYFVLHDTYYIHDDKHNEYEVVDEPEKYAEIVQDSYLKLGTIIKQLPAGSEVEYVNGEQYFSDGVHYFVMVIHQDKGNIAYKVVEPK